MQYFFKLITVFTFLVIFSTVGLAVTLHVPSDFSTIQAGINAAAVGDTVLLESGIFSGEGNRDVDFMGKNITVRSHNNNPATCTIACQGTYYSYHRGFIFQSGESSLARLEGVTISGGNMGYGSEHEDGGGILCINGSDPTIKNCRITHCNANIAGGGLAAINSSPTIRDCQIDNNYADYGGGVMVTGEGPLTMTGSLVMNNDAIMGCGIYIDGPSSFLSECTISGSPRSAIYSSELFTLTYSSIIGNEIGIESTVHPIIEHTLIAFNNTSFFEMGGYPLELNCCNVFGNVHGDYVDDIAAQQGINGNISADPMLCDPDNWDYHVAPDSPCLNDLCGQIGAFGAGDCGTPPSAAGDEIQVASGLRGNYPNPFNPSTTISYELEQDSPVLLQIYDVTGKLIKTLENGSTRTAGMHEAFWNGRDNAGHGVAAGVFLYVLTTSEGRDTGRMALIK